MNTPADKPDLPAPIAVVGDTYAIFWAGAAPIARLVNAHSVKIGDGLYSESQIRTLLADERRMFTEILRRRGKSVLPQALMEARIRADERRKALECFEQVMHDAWHLVDPFNPAGTPGSHARGVDQGIIAALNTVRALMDRVMKQVDRKEPT